MAFSLALLQYTYEHGDWVLVKYDGKFFPGESTCVINNQYQV